MLALEEQRAQWSAGLWDGVERSATWEADANS